MNYIEPLLQTAEAVWETAPTYYQATERLTAVFWAVATGLQQLSQLAMNNPKECAAALWSGRWIHGTAVPGAHDQHPERRFQTYGALFSTLRYACTIAPEKFVAVIPRLSVALPYAHNFPLELIGGVAAIYASICFVRATYLTQPHETIKEKEWSVYQITNYANYGLSAMVAASVIIQGSTPLHIAAQVAAVTTPIFHLQVAVIAINITTYIIIHRVWLKTKACELLVFCKLRDRAPVALDRAF